MAPSKLARDFTLNPDVTKGDLATLTSEAHPTGSPRQAEILGYLEQRMKAQGLTTVREAFTATVPNPAALSTTAGPVQDTLTQNVVNFYATGAGKADANCLVLLASHYDTKIVENAQYVGANDSGSSSLVLLQQLQYLKAATPAAKAALRCDVGGVWFDGEEAVLKNWNDGQTKHPAKIEDHTYGSRYAAGRLTTCAFEGNGAKCLPTEFGGKTLVAIILMDMIGSPDLHITRDGYSTRYLIDLAAEAAKSFGEATRYDAEAKSIEDDHLPYRNAGVPGLDLIDFNDLTHWHKAGDDAETVAAESMSFAGRVALAVALTAASDPIAVLSKP